MKKIYNKIRESIFDALDANVINSSSRDDVIKQLVIAINMVVETQSLTVAQSLRNAIANSIYDELTGLGPLQSLMEDETISDIMVCGVDKIFIERAGKVQKSEIEFIDNQQLTDIAKRIANGAGRRVDESSPLCDARLVDGSRVNIVLPPIAIDGTSISIRKFRKQDIDLTVLAGFGAMSENMARLLMIAARCRLNIVISGGTGSGKTTMINALSRYISEGERIVTIEDAAELRFMQDHVVRLETRPASIEGTGQIDQRQLVINSLRMRPDRVVIGECRGPEAFEMLQAMNTGHDGSMTTLHANTPRDALSRIEGMVMMGNSVLPLEAIRKIIVSSIDLIIQVSRLHDGSRKVMSITEVMGIEGENITLEEIFRFEPSILKSHDEKIQGQFVTSGLMQRSIFFTKAKLFGFEQQLLEVFN